MRILALDTSTYVGTVAVVQHGELLAEWSAMVRASHGETLLPHVERALELSGLTLAELDLIAVGIGPGSFTGVRIGVATAKGLALAEQKQIVGVTSLRALARGLGTGAGLRVPVVDAHKGEVYTAAYELDVSGELIERIAPFHAAPERAAQRLCEVLGDVATLLCGNGLTRYPGVVEQLLGARAVRAPALFDVPRGACVAYEAERELLRNGPGDVARLEPLYLRPSDAKLPTPRTV